MAIEYPFDFFDLLNQGCLAISLRINGRPMNAPQQHRDTAGEKLSLNPTGAPLCFFYRLKLCA